MRLDASAVTPGLAKRFQKGTEPSAKSSQSGVLLPKREQFASICCAGAPFPPASASARTAATRTPNLFTRLTVAARPGDARPRLRTVNGYDLLLVFVEGGVHFRDLFRLDVALPGAAAVFDSRRAAEIEPERAEVDAVAAVGVDLDSAVLLQAGGRRDQLADDHVLLQPEQPVDLALDRRIRQDLGRLLERGGRKEGLGGERCLCDPEDQRLERRLVLLLLLDACVLAVEHRLVDELAGQQIGLARVLDAHLLQHLADDQLDVLVVDLDAL